MDSVIKSGKEILDDFFNTIEQIPEVDSKLASRLKELYRENKLTSTNLSNALSELREEAQNDKN
jgi:hypothetical protein